MSNMPNKLTVGVSPIINAKKCYNYMNTYVLFTQDGESVTRGNLDTFIKGSNAFIDEKVFDVQDGMYDDKSIEEICLIEFSKANICLPNNVKIKNVQNVERFYCSPPSESEELIDSVSSFNDQL